MAPKSRRPTLPKAPASTIVTESAAPIAELDRGAERLVFGLLLAWVFVLCVFRVASSAKAARGGRSRSKRPVSSRAR